jgi:starch synthase
LLHIFLFLIVFIGRLVGEKAADVLPGAIQHAMDKTNCGANFFIIGAGDTATESALNYLVNCILVIIILLLGMMKK